MTPTLEEIARTISIAVWDFDYTPRNPNRPDERWAQALMAAAAVLDKHVREMLEEACEQARDSRSSSPSVAARILKSVKGE